MNNWIQFSSVSQSCLILCDPMNCSTPGLPVYSNACLLSWRCHPTVSSSVILFSSCPQSFPVSGSFQMGQFFTSGAQTIGVSASASVLPMNIQDWFRLVGSSCSPRDSWESSPTPQFKIVSHCFPLFPHLFAMKWRDRYDDFRFLNVEF